MRALSFFLFILISALLSGALLAYPAHLSLAPFADLPFHKIISRTTLFSGLIFSLLYLRAYGLLSLKDIGWHNSQRSPFRPIMSGFAVGFIILLIVTGSKLVLGIYEFDVNADLSIKGLSILAVKALLTGLFVSLVEETIFRGALFTGLGKQTNIMIALFVTSLIYAAVHFIKFRALDPNIELTWHTGVQMFPVALFRFSDPVTIDSFLTIFILGILFCLMRIQSGNLFQCFGLHAGIVAFLKVSYYFTDHVRTNDWNFLVNKYEHQFGYLTTACLLIVISFYYFFVMRKPAGILQNNIYRD